MGTSDFKIRELVSGPSNTSSPREQCTVGNRQARSLWRPSLLKVDVKLLRKFWM